jgi:hypothetical protein
LDTIRALTNTTQQSSRSVTALSRIPLYRGGEVATERTAVLVRRKKLDMQFIERRRRVARSNRLRNPRVLHVSRQL